jgi:hypothetical protein
MCATRMEYSALLLEHMCRDECKTTCPNLLLTELAIMEL